MEMNDHLYVPAALNPEEITRRLNGPQSRSGRYEEEKKVSYPCWESNPDFSVAYPVA
jgi:hypothetical protein